MRRRPTASYNLNAFPKRLLKDVSGTFCPICNNPVAMESAKTDENGHAVHEDCYVLKIKLEKATADPHT